MRLPHGIRCDQSGPCFVRAPLALRTRLFSTLTSGVHLQATHAAHRGGMTSATMGLASIGLFALSVVLGFGALSFGAVAIPIGAAVGLAVCAAHELLISKAVTPGP